MKKRNIARKEVPVERVEQRPQARDDRLSLPEMELLQDLSAALPDRQSIVVLGAWATEAVRCLLVESGERRHDIYCVEPFPPELPESHEELAVTRLCATPREAVRRWSGKVGLLLVNLAGEDGGMAHALPSWKRFLSPGAAVVVRHSALPEEMKAVKRQLGSFRELTITKTLASLIVMEKDSCIHHWMVDTSNTGTCRLCMKKRSFRGR